MKNSFNKNVIYYTIINKNQLNFIKPNITDEKSETLQSKYILNHMLDYFNIPKGEIKKTALGKQFFKDKHIFFNYSHSNNFIACAISKYNVGIDIEETNRIITDAMINICGFSKDTSLEEFVKREALCKLTGNGILEFFDKNYFQNTHKNNLVIKNKKYVCVICSSCLNPIYIKKDFAK